MKSDKEKNNAMNLTPTHEYLMEDLMNIYLVKNKIRDAYLIQSFLPDEKEIDKRIKIIKMITPNINVFRSNNYYFLSLILLNEDDINCDEKIGKLLRFDCPNKFSELNRDIETVTYKIIVKGVHKDINLITYICQDNSKIDSAQKLKNEIKTSLLKNETFKQIISDIDLKVEINRPINSVKELLYKTDYIINSEDIKLINDTIFNSFFYENYNNIIENIDYNNQIHRGILLSIISEFNFNPLKPFYPLQNCNKYNEIKINENKRINFLVDIIKSTK